jgi:hypothetical protein
MVRRRRRGRLAGAAGVALLAIAWCGVAPARAAEAYSEDAVIAAYLYRIAGYVDWPDEGAGSEPFSIAVYGAPAIERELKRLMPGHLIHNHPVEVREMSGARDLNRPGRVQILFVGAGYGGTLHALLAALGSKPTLVVSDEDGGLDEGSMLNFVTIDHRVRFEVSLTAADRSNLKISSELLAVAVRVRGGGRQSRESCIPRDTPGDLDTGCGIFEVRIPGAKAEL